MKRVLRVLCVSSVLLLSLTVSARAGISIDNSTGTVDGKYYAVIESNKTRERSETYPADLEGLFLTVHYPDGDVVYKVSDIYDRRTELEASIFNKKTQEYMTVHLDDNKHILHSETRERLYQEQKKKQMEREQRIREKMKARKKKAAEAGVPAPAPSPSPETAGQP